MNHNEAVSYRLSAIGQKSEAFNSCAGVNNFMALKGPQTIAQGEALGKASHQTPSSERA
jgi:hypothetical protein